MVVHEIDDPGPRVFLLRRIQAAATGRDAAFGRHADHLGHHQTGTTECLASQMYQVKIAGHAVHGGIHVHRRHHDPVRQLQFADPERLEHRRPGLGAE